MEIIDKPLLNFDNIFEVKPLNINTIAKDLSAESCYRIPHSIQNGFVARILCIHKKVINRSSMTSFLT